MKREIWPEEYHQPSWLYSLRSGVELSRRLNRMWLGAGFALLSIVSFYEGGEDDEGARHVNPRTLVVLAGSASLCSFFLALVVGEPKGELYLKWLQQKARADSYEREWSDDDLLEIERNAEWIENFRENMADEIEQRRMSKWWSRFFWKHFFDGSMQRPTAIHSFEAQYLRILAAEIRSRRIAKPLRASQNQ